MLETMQTGLPPATLSALVNAAANETMTYLTVRQVALLALVRAFPGIGVRELAEAARMPKPSVCRGMMRLVQCGLVERATDGVDLRLRMFTATPKGADLIALFGETPEMPLAA